MLLKFFWMFTDALLPARTRRLEHHTAADSRYGFRKVDRLSHRGLWFAVLCCFIGAVSVHDAYLLLYNRQDILEHEKNPLGRWLIEAGGGDVILFVAVKLTTTSVVCSSLVWIYQRRPRQAQYITTGVAAFQFGLLLYLMGAWG